MAGGSLPVTCMSVTVVLYVRDGDVRVHVRDRSVAAGHIRICNGDMRVRRSDLRVHDGVDMHGHMRVHDGDKNVDGDNMRVLHDDIHVVDDALQPVKLLIVAGQPFRLVNLYFFANLG